MDDDNTTINLVMPRWMKKKLDDVCSRIHKPCANRSAALRDACKDWLMKHGEELPEEGEG
jgi:hypothetical protein